MLGLQAYDTMSGQFINFHCEITFLRVEIMVRLNYPFILLLTDPNLQE